MVPAPTKVALRRGVLAVCVLNELDLTPAYDAVVLDGEPEVRVPWRLCRRALAGADPESELGRLRLAELLLGARNAGDLGAVGLEINARPLGIPVDHPLHPGLDWVRRRVLGDTLDLGIGFAGLDAFDPDRVLPVAPSVLDVLGINSDPWWAEAESYLEDMGAMAALRWRRAPDAPLRPMGDCDVITLLGSRVLRRALAGPEVAGMATVAAPIRSRGWLDLARIDPAFAAAAATIADLRDRGFGRPLLITPEEVVEAVAGGRPAEIVLRDPAVPTPHIRDVRYHQT